MWWLLAYYDSIAVEELEMIADKKLGRIQIWDPAALSQKIA